MMLEKMLKTFQKLRLEFYRKIFTRVRERDGSLRQAAEGVAAVEGHNEQPVREAEDGNEGRGATPEGGRR